MYDPLETKTSEKYLEKILKACEKKEILGKIAVIGGWGVKYLINKEYLRATGREYLKSRDIDLFIPSSVAEKFLRIIKEIGFMPSAYKFRYEVICTREKGKKISEEQARKQPVHNLIYVFLDVFSEKKTKLGAWVIPELGDAKKIMINSTPVLDAEHLLKIKTVSFFEREKLDKRFKDACDAYALIFYSGLDKKKADRHLIKRLAESDEYCYFIAEQLYGDPLKAGLIRRSLEQL